MKLDKDSVREIIITELKTIFDPEIPVNIYDLGLIYDVDIADDYDVHIKMTLTTPACPVAHTFPGTVETKIRALPDVGEVLVELVWEPPWTDDRMTEGAKLELGML